MQAIDVQKPRKIHELKKFKANKLNFKTILLLSKTILLLFKTM